MTLSLPPFCDTCAFTVACEEVLVALLQVSVTTAYVQWWVLLTGWRLVLDGRHYIPHSYPGLAGLGAQTLHLGRSLAPRMWMLPVAATKRLRAGVKILLWTTVPSRCALPLPPAEYLPNTGLVSWLVADSNYR